MGATGGFQRFLQHHAKHAEPGGAELRSLELGGSLQLPDAEMNMFNFIIMIISTIIITSIIMLFSLVGFKGNLSLLNICGFVSSRLRQMEVSHHQLTLGW